MYMHIYTYVCIALKIQEYTQKRTKYSAKRKPSGNYTIRAIIINIIMVSIVIIIVCFIVISCIVSIISISIRGIMCCCY